jgi:hypothetical protein
LKDDLANILWIISKSVAPEQRFEAPLFSGAKGKETWLKMISTLHISIIRQVSES